MRPANASGRIQLRSRWVEVEGARLHAYVGGSGPPVVLVHGFGVSGTYMLPLARALASSLHVHVLDLPGHGRSETPRSRPSIASFSEALGRWLDGARLRNPAFVANSMGCQVVTDLAVREPCRVGAMVLIGPTVDPSRRSARHQVLAGLRDLGREPASLVVLSLGDDAGVGLPTLVALARSALSDPIEERLPSIEQPTTIVRGADDAFSSDVWGRDAARLLPHGRLVVVPGEPHAVHYTRPRLVAAIVREAIADARDAQRLVG
jgi:2-hydroxy-6-oxonona-2,4-dienedioate hydrolase